MDGAKSALTIPTFQGGQEWALNRQGPRSMYESGQTQEKRRLICQAAFLFAMFFAPRPRKLLAEAAFHQAAQQIHRFAFLRPGAPD